MFYRLLFTGLITFLGVIIILFVSIPKTFFPRHVVLIENKNKEGTITQEKSNGEETKVMLVDRLILPNGDWDEIELMILCKQDKIQSITILSPVPSYQGLKKIDWQLIEKTVQQEIEKP